MRWYTNIKNSISNVENVFDYDLSPIKHIGNSAFPKLISLFIAMVFTFIHSRAQERDTVQVLNEVQVKGYELKNQLSAVQKLNIKRGDVFNSFSVADAIRYFSGVQIKDYGGIGGIKTINVRNMGSQHVGVFFNGVQLGNAQNGQIDLGKFSLDNIEEISLYNAQNTELLQPARNFSTASSVYLKSTHPAFEKNKNNQGSFKAKTGSFGLFNASLHWSYKITDSIYTQVSVEKILAHGRYKFRYKKINADGSIAYDTTALRRNGDIDANRLEFSFRGGLKNGDWKSHFYYYESERGLPGYIANNLFNHSQRQWDQNLFIQNSYSQKINPNYNILLNVKFAKDFTRYVDNDSTKMIVDNRYEQWESYLSIAQEYRVSPILKFGLSNDFIYTSLRANLKNFAFPTRQQWMHAFTGNLQLNKINLQSTLLLNTLNNSVKNNTSTKNYNILTPAFNVAYQPFNTKNFHLRFFYKNIFRPPTFNDLYYTIIGSASLKPEFTEQFNIGLSYRKQFAKKLIKETEIKVDAYYNEVTDKIVAIPTSNPFRWMMLNLGFVKIKGLEISTSNQVKISNTIQSIIKLNYTLQSARDFTNKNDSFYKDFIPYAPLHSFSSTLQLNYKKWQVNYSFLYTGERYSQKANIARNYMPAWYTSDIGVTKLFQLFSFKCTSSIEVNNLLNQYYDVVINYPMPGRNFKINFSFNF